MKILDCTLRDGGYLTDWYWDIDLVNDTIDALNSCGVDIIELGYKSPIIENRLGRFRYCEDYYLNSVIKEEYKHNDFCFMIDLKDYIDNGKLDSKLLKNTIGRSDFFTYARIAIKQHEMKCTEEAVDILDKLGYKVFLNIMYASFVGEDDFCDISHTTKDWPIEALYFADSFGQLSAKNVKHFARMSMQNVGIHLHNNNGGALQSALHASIFVEYVDATILGMGRGAGNIDIAKLLLFEDENPNEILKVQEKYFQLLKDKYQWGPDICYSLSAKLGIHPLYNQCMIQGGVPVQCRYVKLLELPGDKHIKYEKGLI